MRSTLQPLLAEGQLAAALEAVGRHFDLERARGCRAGLSTSPAALPLQVSLARHSFFNLRPPWLYEACRDRWEICCRDAPRTGEAWPMREPMMIWKRTTKLELKFRERVQFFFLFKVSLLFVFVRRIFFWMKLPRLKLVRVSQFALSLVQGTWLQLQDWLRSLHRQPPASRSPYAADLHTRLPSTS